MCSDDRRNRSARQPAPIATDRSEMSPLIEARQQRAILVLPQSRQCSVELCGAVCILVTSDKTSSEDPVRGIAIKERLEPCPSQIDRDGTALRVVPCWVQLQVVPAADHHDLPVIRDVTALQVAHFIRRHSVDAVEHKE